MVMPRSGNEKNRRFYLHIASQVIVFVTIFGLILVATERMNGVFGIAIAIVAGISLGLAALLGKSVLVDWMSLRILHRKWPLQGLILKTVYDPNNLVISGK